MSLVTINYVWMLCPLQSDHAIGLSIWDQNGNLLSLQHDRIYIISMCTSRLLSQFTLVTLTLHKASRFYITHRLHLILVILFTNLVQNQYLKYLFPTVVLQIFKISPDILPSL